MIRIGVALVLCTATLAIQKRAESDRKSGRTPSTLDRAAIVFVLIAVFIVHDASGWDIATIATFVLAMLAAPLVILGWTLFARPSVTRAGKPGRPIRDRKASPLRAPGPREVARGTSTWKMLAALLLGLPIGAFTGMCIARYLPIGADARFVLGYLLTLPSWVLATCGLVLARSAARAWSAGLALSVITGVLALRP